MSLHDEVSWPIVEGILREAFGASTRLEEMSLLHGGFVNTTLSVKVREGDRYVLKISGHRVNRAHEREARSLVLLGELGVPVPEVVTARTASLEQPHSYVLMRFVEGVGLKQAMKLCDKPQAEALQTELAEIVLRMHDCTGEVYGKVEGAPYTDWPDFYHDLVHPIIVEADRLHELPLRTVKAIHRIHDHLDTLVRHEDVPRLLHGDLWHANVLCAREESGDWHIAALLDPEARWGHVEAELAYMDLFQTSAAPFRKAYQTHRPLPRGYFDVRKSVYQLYGLVNQYQMHHTSESAAMLVEAADKVAQLV